MKHLHLAALLTMWAATAQAQPVFFEDFESGVPGQMTQEYVTGVLDWNNDGGYIGAVQDPFVDGAQAAFFFFDDYTYDETALVTPVLDLSAGFFRLGFWHVQGMWAGDQNTLTVEVSTDGGTNWTTIDYFTGDVPLWTYREYNLGDYVTLTATTQVRFIGYISYGYAVGLDAISIFPPEATDAIGSAILSPVTGCGLGTESVSLVVTNDGTSDITTIDAGYSLDGAAAVTETFAVTIAPGDSDTLTFTQTVDVSVFGDYTVQAWSALSGDLDTSNDTVSITLTNVPAIVGLPYFNDFESGNAGWTSNGTNGDWQLGDPEGLIIDTAFSGVNAWVTNLTPNYNNDQVSYLTSPCFDLSATPIDPILSFAIAFDSEENYDGTWVEVSTDGGVSWTTVGNVGTGDNWYNVDYADVFNANVFNSFWGGMSNGTGEWMMTEHLLTGAAGSSSVRFRIAFNSDVSANLYNGFAIDDIRLEEQPPVNAEVYAVVSPVSGCGLGAAENVTVSVVNAGSTPIADIELLFTIDDQLPVSETFNVNLNPLDTATVTFAQTVDLSIAADYTITVWAVLPSDTDSGNDTVMVTVGNYPIITGLPYLIDFETGNGGWSSTGTNGIWELGDPIGAVIDTAHSGVNCWVTNLNTVNYADDQYSLLTSPCFDMSAVNLDPILRFAIAYNSETNYDGVWVEVSTDGGQNWSVVGTVGSGINWYNMLNADIFNGLVPGDFWGGNSNGTGEWIEVEHLLTGAAGSGDVKVRFTFSSDPSVSGYEGFAVDDISLEEQPAINAEVLNVVSPLSGCALSNSETLTVTVVNAGFDPITDLEVFYSVDGQTAQSETFTVNLNSLDTGVVTFTSTLDLSSLGAHGITVWAVLPNDGDLDNDTVSVQVWSYPLITSVPYFIDFENGDGGWTSEGTNGVWELGDPTGTIIDNAFSGTNCWATNLNTLLYQNQQLSYLTSPCFDLSSLTDDPLISFALQFNSETNWDGVWVEKSIDGGLTWSIVGNVGQGMNWYNTANAFNAVIPGPSWTGNSGTASEWVTAETMLSGVAGEASVKVRFIFSSDFSGNTWEGFALDDIFIYPQPQFDLVALGMPAPESGCDLGDETVKIKFWNKGLQTVQNFQVGYAVDGGAPVTQNCPLVVAHGDTAVFTFSTPADLSASGLHLIDVFTALQGDEYPNTDLSADNEVTNYANTPLAQTITTSEPVSGNIPAGTHSSIYFCGLPTALNGCFRINSVTIGSLPHAYPADMLIYLISPAGDTVALSLGNGGGVPNVNDVVFSDAAATSITTQVNGIAAGTYQPQQPLSDLYDGQDPNGAWTLYIEDTFFGDDGELQEWGISFLDNAPQPQLGSDIEMCVNYTDTITVTGGNFSSVLWSNGWSGNPVIFSGDDLGVGAHDISVIVDIAGCTGFSDTITVTVNECVGIEEADGAAISVYPNPSAGAVTIDVPAGVIASQVRITDATGRTVSNTAINGGPGRRSVEVSNLAKGVYMLVVEGEGILHTERLVVR
jgi:subtilisin-like proprotein convertase family protein